MPHATADPVRPDLAAAHADVWAAIGRPGAVFTGAQRSELAVTVLDAWSDPAARPPWVARSSDPASLPRLPLAPAVAHDVVDRVAAHAATLTEAWYRQAVDALSSLGLRGELAMVELVSLTCQVAAIAAFRRAAGLPTWAVPVGTSEPPTGHVADPLAVAALNWVPVAAPADQRAAVVQAFTALPDEHARTWRLADAQYIPDAEMVDPRWSRGTLTRSQMELVACRVAQLRQCFF